MPADPKPATSAKPPIRWNLWLFGALLLVIGLALIAVSLEYGSTIRRWLRSTGASSTISDMAVLPGCIATFFGLMFIGRAILADIIQRFFPPIVGRCVVIGVGVFWVCVLAVMLIPPAFAKAKAAWAACDMSGHLASAKGWLSANGTVLIVVLLAIIVVLLGLIVMHLRSGSTPAKPKP